MFKQKTIAVNRWCLWILLATVFACGLCEPSAADNIDNELLVRAPMIIKECRNRGYSRVGVLTFMYQRENQSSKFTGAAICSNMATRLENALALKISSQEPQFVLLPQAAEHAAHTIKAASYRTPADRERLFGMQLLPLWGDSRAQTADAFLIGKVRASRDFRMLTISIGAFDRQSLFDIVEFSVKTDRYALADLGQGFSAARNRVRGVSDDDILTGVAIGSQQTGSQQQDAAAVSSADVPVQLTVYYDQQPQSVRDDAAADGSFNYALQEPRPGQSLTFGLRNVTDKPLGVVLLVNGVSTLYEQEGDAADLTKWVLLPGKEYRVKGFHQEGNEKYFEITTLTEEESQRRYDDLGGAKFAGLIHLHVFQQRTDNDEVPAFTRSIGRLGRRERPNTPYPTVQDAQRAIAVKSDLFPPGVRPLAGWGRERNESLAETQLGQVVLTSTLVIRYSQTKP